MKNYILFFYRGEYPKGGFNDFYDSYKTADEAYKAADKLFAKEAKTYNCSIDEVEASFHIFDLKKKKIYSSVKATMTPLNYKKRKKLHLRF